MATVMALAGCTPTPYSAAKVADKREERVFAYMLKVGNVMIPQYQDEWTLIATDAQTCDVSSRTYAETEIGQTITCQWGYR